MRPEVGGGGVGTCGACGLWCLVDLWGMRPGDLWGRRPGDLWGMRPGDLWGMRPGDLWGMRPGVVLGHHTTQYGP